MTSCQLTKNTKVAVTEDSQLHLFDLKRDQADAAEQQPDSNRHSKRQAGDEQRRAGVK